MVNKNDFRLFQWIEILVVNSQSINGTRYGSQNYKWSIINIVNDWLYLDVYDRSDMDIYNRWRFIVFAPFSELNEPWKIQILKIDRNYEAQELQDYVWRVLNLDNLNDFRSNLYKKQRVSVFHNENIYNDCEILDEHWFLWLNKTFDIENFSYWIENENEYTLKWVKPENIIPFIG